MFRRWMWQLGFRPCRPHGRTAPFILSPIWELVLTLIIGVALAVWLVIFLGEQIRPVAALAARTQGENTIIRAVEEVVMEVLAEREVGYSDFVTIERNSGGRITAIITDMASMNRMRSHILERVLEELEGIQVSDINIPLGSLLDIDFLWAKGPQLKVHSMSVGTVQAEFESEFTGAGVNQTVHRIWLEVTVPLTLILPGDRVEAQGNTRIPIAETVIVGEVPSYLRQAG